MESLRVSAGKWRRLELTLAIADERRPHLCAIRTAAFPDAELRRQFLAWGGRQLQYGGDRVPAHIEVARFLREEIGCS